MARDGDFDVWILDRQMPDGDCANALRELRSAGLSTPALLLTAARAVEKRVEGFDAGADDYLTKPFSILELVARVRALLRRPQAIRTSVVRSGTVALDLGARRIFIAGGKLPVTPHEWRLLAMLAQRPGTIVSRKQIMVEIGVADTADETAVDHIVSRLRSKLRERNTADLIRTVRGLGLVWDTLPSSAC